MSFQGGLSAVSGGDATDEKTASTFLVLGLAAALLSGCIGGENIQNEESDPSAAPEKADEATFSETTGAIEGTVASELFEPLAGARIALLDEARQPIGKEAIAARDGKFSVSDLEPGNYIIHASAIGFESLQKIAQVEAGKVTQVPFLLTPLPHDGPWVEDDTVDGFINLAVAWQVEPPGVGCLIIPTPIRDVKSCSGIRYGGDNGETRIGPETVPEGWPGNGFYHMETDLADAKTILVEMAWDPAGPLGEHLQIDLLCSEEPRGSGGAVLDPDHPCYFLDGGASPLIHRVDEEHWLEHGYNYTGQWAARVFATYGLLGTHGLTGIDIGVAYQQEFTIYITIFHGEPGPEEYSGIPDA